MASARTALTVGLFRPAAFFSPALTPPCRRPAASTAPSASSPPCVLLPQPNTKTYKKSAPLTPAMSCAALPARLRGCGAWGAPVITSVLLPGARAGARDWGRSASTRLPSKDLSAPRSSPAAPSRAVMEPFLTLHSFKVGKLGHWQGCLNIEKGLISLGRREYQLLYVCSIQHVVL